MGLGMGGKPKPGWEWEYRGLGWESPPPHGNKWQKAVFVVLIEERRCLMSDELFETLLFCNINRDLRCVGPSKTKLCHLTE